MNISWIVGAYTQITRAERTTAQKKKSYGIRARNTQRSKPQRQPYPQIEYTIHDTLNRNRHGWQIMAIIIIISPEYKQ